MHINACLSIEGDYDAMQALHMFSVTDVHFYRHAVTAKAGMPPVFIAFGEDDRADISEGIANVYLKYKEAKVPAEMHNRSSSHMKRRREGRARLLEVD